MDNNRTTLIFYLPTTKKKTVIVSGRIEIIYQFAFQSCHHLKEVIICDGALKRIGFEAFKDCINLIRVELPDTLETIEEGAFADCPKLKCGCIHMPNKLTEQALGTGKVPASVLTDVCLASECTLSEQMSCRGSNISYKQFIRYIFIVILS